MTATLAAPAAVETETTGDWRTVLVDPEWRKILRAWRDRVTCHSWNDVADRWARGIAQDVAAGRQTYEKSLAAFRLADRIAKLEEAILIAQLRADRLGPSS